MSSRLLVDLFVEDRAHEEFLTPLLARVAREEEVEVSIHVRSARGGHGRAIEEFRLYQDVVEKGAAGSLDPDLLIVAIDGNCSSGAKKRVEIQGAAKPVFLHRLIVACPDPHIERWYLGDPDSFQAVVGHRPPAGRKKCVRDHYKGMLAKAVQQARHPATLGGIEFARELVDAMDLYRAGRIDRSFKVFVDDLRARFRGRHSAAGATAP
jgi:hypothetical protein